MFGRLPAVAGRPGTGLPTGGSGARPSRRSARPSASWSGSGRTSSGASGVILHAKVRLGDWIESWLATTVNLRPSSRARDESYLRNHVLPAFGTAPLGRITQLDVRAWVADLTASGLAPATVHKAYQTLSKVLRSAVDGGLIAQSPCRRVALPKVERQEMPFLTPAEVPALADAMTDRYRAMVVFDAYCGLRLGELAGLRRGRVDLLHRQARVIEIAVEVKGQLVFNAPKTSAGNRTVPIPPSVAERLADHMAQFSGEGPDGLVFPGADGGALRANAWRQRHWQAATRATGLAGLRPHDLRHTAVSLWIARGQPQADRHVGRPHLRGGRPGPLRPPPSRSRGVGPRRPRRPCDEPASARW
jgi:integrase